MLDTVFSRFRTGATGAYSSWTDERVARLRELYANGESYSVIASELGVTRNAVSGKVDRLGLDPRPDRRRRFSQIGRTKPRKNSFRVRALLARAGDPLIEEKAQPAPQEFLGLTLMELTEATCRYPRGDGPFVFCGAQPVLPGTAYCAGCAQICFNLVASAASKAKGEQTRDMARRYRHSLRDAPP